jgi:hypothetical protein
MSLRDLQYAMRHADSRTTLHHDIANLDRRTAHALGLMQTSRRENTLRILDLLMVLTASTWTAQTGGRYQH